MPRLGPGPQVVWTGCRTSRDRSRWPTRSARTGSGLARAMHPAGCCGWMSTRGWLCPPQAQESVRDLVRASEAVRSDLMRSRHRVSKLLLRHGIVNSGGKAWTAAHDSWLPAQRFELSATRAAFEDAYETVVLTTGLICAWCPTRT